ncbi:MAG: hypothetical protein K2K46_13725 [Lachnospiraceae bacterium]|nr:hypothetical protein [Lachnospiraceae bacterium]
MDVRETTKLGETLEGILQDINDDAKRGTAIEDYLYQAQEKRILIPESLWNIIICLDKELEERESDKKAELNYQSKVFDYNNDCNFLEKCVECWSTEKLVFAVDASNMRIRIADKPSNWLECSEKRVGNLTYKFCAVCLRGCLYQYMTSRECYIPEEFYSGEMFVFFLYSFDAFYTCFKYCIEAGIQSLNAVFRDLLWLVFKYRGLSEKRLEKKLNEDSSDRAEFLKEIIYNCKAMGMASYSELNSILGDFVMAMRSNGKKIVDLLRENEVKAGRILGDDLLEKMLKDLKNRNWLF